jgi:hypothetical protein
MIIYHNTIHLVIMGKINPDITMLVLKIDIDKIVKETKVIASNASITINSFNTVEINLIFRDKININNFLNSLPNYITHIVVQETQSYNFERESTDDITTNISNKKV